MVRRHKRHLSQPGRKNHHLMELIKDFFENTSFSGLRYIFEPGRMIIERIFWIVMAAVSTAALLVVIAFLWTKFQNDPTIISLDTDSMMFNHPYMAFLICPLELRPYNDTNRLINRYNFSQLVTGDRQHYRLWPNETLEGRIFLISFFETLMNISYENIEPLMQFLGDRRLKGLSLQKILLEVIPLPSDWIRRINNDKLLEMSLLGAVLTDSGLCWTFNSIAHSNFKDTTRDNKWKLEGGGNKYITMPGSKNVKISIAVYFFNHNVPLKFKTYILAPWEVPEPTDTAWFSSGLNGMRFDHQSMTTICTSDVRNLPIRRRGCLFMDENIASAVSPVYSQKACKMQCRLKMTIEMCQCAPYFFPIPVGVDECDLEGMLCIHKYSDVIRSAGRQDNANSNCHCPSLCEQTTFKIVLTKELVGIQCLVNNFHFPPTLVQYKRQILFSDMDLLVSFGGIINLFLGLSLLSSVEVVYYLIFRLPATLWRQRALGSGNARTSGVDPTMGVFCTSERCPVETDGTVRKRYKQRLVLPGPMKRGETREHGEYQEYTN